VCDYGCARWCRTKPKQDGWVGGHCCAFDATPPPQFQIKDLMALCVRCTPKEAWEVCMRVCACVCTSARCMCQHRDSGCVWADAGRVGRQGLRMPDHIHSRGMGLDELGVYVQHVFCTMIACSGRLSAANVRRCACVGVRCCTAGSPLASPSSSWPSARRPLQLS